MTQRPDLLKLAERGRSASNVHASPRDPNVPREYVPPPCPGCEGAAVHVRFDPPTRDCYHCDQRYEQQEPCGWLALGPAPRKVVAA